MYNAESIKVLSDIEHIRKNPGMYIGDVDTPRHLLQECIDNAIDEVTNGYSSGFEIHITKTSGDDMIYKVVDYGRGIPTGYKEINGQNFSILEVLTTKSNSGGKFDNKAYLSSSGLHGLGLKCVTALSDRVSIKSINNGVMGEIQLDNAEVTIPVNYVETEEHSGTSIEFKVNNENIYFNNNQIPFDYIVDKLNMYQAFGIQGIKLFLNGIDVTETYVLAHSPFDLHKHPMDNGQNAIILDEIVENSKGEKFRIAFNYVSSSSTSYKFNGYTNYLYNKDGGGHITAAQKAIIKAFHIFCDKRNITYPSDMSSDYFIGLNCIVSVNIIKKAFASQTKDKLITGTGTTLSYFNELIELMAESINKVFDRNVGVIKALIQRIADYRKERENRKELKGLSQYITINQSTTSTVRRGSVYEKLTECSSKNRDECELIMTEGDSASGGLIRTRNKQTTAILPLKGKIKNVVGCSITEILKNKEIAGIISSVGCGILDKCDVNRMRYFDVLYAGDADADGYHIINLVIALFVNLMPEVVKQGHLKLITSPLYVYKDKNNEWQGVDRFDDMPKSIRDKGQFTRIKGLGELNDDQVKEFLLNKEKRHVVTVEYPSDLEEFNSIMSTSDGRRNLLTGLGLLQE